MISMRLCSMQYSLITSKCKKPFCLQSRFSTFANITRSPRALSTAFVSKAAPEQEENTESYDEPLSAYIHLPFCKKKCFYCDFPVIAVGTRPDHRIEDTMTNYVDAICREIAATKKLNHTTPLHTVFFGGGTPSLISPALLSRLLTALDTTYGIASDAEISIEADPGTFTADQLRTYRSLGMSRVSVGVQSFNDTLLTTCGRAHDVADVYRAIEAVYSSNIPVWSLDLMSGLPGLTMDIWEGSLEAALDARPNHMSVYDLQIEEHTPFGKQYRPGVSPLPSDDDTARMYSRASTILRNAGFEHYEISNYATPGNRCKHNMTYWERRQYYAFGMGSASYLQGQRFSRPRKLNSYLQWLHALEEEQTAHKGQPSVPSGNDVVQETAEDRLTDTIMLRLRLTDGLDLKKLAVDFKDGPDIVDIIIDTLKIREEMGHITFHRANESSSSKSSKYTSIDVQERRVDTHKRQGSAIERVTLVDPEGFLVSNDIISDIFAAIDEMKYS